ncbi:MAG TPA: PAS domain S-box protein [bacterium]
MPRRLSPQLIALLLIIATFATGAIVYSSLVLQRPEANPPPGAIVSTDPAFLRTLLILVGAAAVLIAAWQIRSRLHIAAAIHTLAAAADRLRRGDLTVRSGLTAEPEDLGLLARSLDEMAASLQRQRAEQIVQEGAHRLSAPLATAMLEAEPDAVILMDHLGRIVQFNRAAERLFGYSRVDVIGQPMVDRIIPPRLRHRHQQGFTRHMTTGEITLLDRTVQFPAMRADGSEFPVELLISRLATDGPPVFVGFIRDITEQTRAEAALRDSEERLRLMIAGVEDYAIFMVDPEGRVMSWNQGAERIKGYTAEEIIGAPMSRFYTSEDVAWLKPERALEAAAAMGKFEDEGWRLRKDGSRFWANTVLTALRDRNGGLRGFVKVVRDISSRRDAEVALRSRELELQRTNALITALARVAAHLGVRADPDAVFETLGAELRALEMTCVVATLRGGTDQIFVRFMSVTPTAVQVAEKLSGVRMRDFPIPRERFPLFAAMIDRGEAGWVPDGAAVAALTIPWLPGPVIAQVMRAVNLPPGTPAIYAPLEVEGRAIGFISVWGPTLQERDVPALTIFAGQVAAALEQARLIEELRGSSERAQSTSRRLVERQDVARRRLSDALQQDIGAKLAELKAAVERVGPAASPAARSDLGDIQAKIEDLARRVREVSLTLWPRVLEQQGLIPTVQWLIDTYGTQAQLKVTFAHDGADTRHDPAVEAAAYHVVQEALENIARHSGTRAAEVRVSISGGMLVIQVEDRGAGFSPQVVMERGASGLAELKERVAAAGGQLVVESSVGRGTRVRATFPAA